MPASLDPQLQMDERAITNPDLEAALERRLRAKDDVSEVRGVYKVAHKEVTRLLDTLDEFPADTALRGYPHLIDRDRIDTVYQQYVDERWITLGEAFRRGAAHVVTLEHAYRGGFLPEARRRGLRIVVPERMVPELASPDADARHRAPSPVPDLRGDPGAPKADTAATVARGTGVVSQGEPVPRAEALAIAERLVGALAFGCERIEIAGSLRREKPMVRDIEIVAVPRWDARPVGLGLEQETYDVLESSVSWLMEEQGLLARWVENHRADGSIDRQTKLGPSFKALVSEGFPVDLFIVRPPATWGCIFGLRTGPGDWNTRLVMDCKAIGRRVEGGQVVAWHSATGSWKAVPTPEEADFFRALGQPWVEPRHRRVERVHIERAIAAGVPA